MTDCWWLSFVKDDTFAGVCVVPVPDGLGQGLAGMRAAVLVSHRLGCNPGGEVQGTPFSSEEPESQKLLETYPIGELIDEATLRANGERKQGEWDSEANLR